MATFLTTAKMNPALAARVERAVHGGRSSPMLVRRLTALARVALVLTIGFAIWSYVTTRRQQHRDLDQARSALLATIDKESATISNEDKQAVKRAELWLDRLAGDYGGDVVTDEVRGAERWKATLSRPIVYLRGPLESLRSSPKVAEAAINSRKDALLLCLLEAPAARTEPALLDKVRPAYLGGATFEDRTANVRRLQEINVGLPFFLPPWSERVKAATESAEVTRLRTDFEKAPLERTRQAVKADLFLVAIDEPGDGKSPTELDGERPHAIRLHLVDVRASKILLSQRRSVDPSWISAAKRVTYASGLDACGFAFDVHETVKKPR